jgi:pimeloyl-ACP methyl ester carboxylesterase
MASSQEPASQTRTGANRLSPGTHTFSANGITFAYHITGTGPLLVNQTVGWGIGPSYTLNGWHALEEHLTILTFIPRGTAPSTRPEKDEDMSTLTMSHDLEALRRHIGAEKMNLAGHSNAGAIALYYAQRYPERVDKLVLIDHGLKGYTDRATMQKFIDAAKADPKKTPSLEVYLGIVTGKVQPKTDEEFASYLRQLMPYYMADVEKTGILLETMTELPCAYALVQKKADAGAASPSHLRDLDKVTARTLVISGMQDPVCPSTHGRLTAEGVRGARFLEYEDCGHFPWVEKPERFFGDVVRFLKDEV